MKLRRITIFILTFFLSFSACKKGDDDPAISFRSRKSRVVGNWKATSYKWIHIWTYQGKSYSQSLTMNDGQCTEVITDGGGTNSSTGLLTFTCKIEKDGKYSSTISADALYTKTSAGVWNFTSGIGGVKNKSQIILHEETNSGDSTSVTNTGNYVSDEFDIRELRNKKMVWYQKVTRSDGNGGEPSSDEYEITFEQ